MAMQGNRPVRLPDRRTAWPPGNSSLYPFEEGLGLQLVLDEDDTMSIYIDDTDTCIEILADSLS